MKNTNQNRRDFLKISSLTGIGLVLGFRGYGKDIESLNVVPAAVDIEINPFIIIKTDGSITLMNHRPDMGQGAFQATSSMIAEELEVSIEQIKVLMADGNPKYGMQMSGGSNTVRMLWESHRKVGAAAKEMLVEAASKRWNASVSDCYAKEGRVYLKSSDKSFGYGELVEEASKLPIPKNPKLKDPKDFKIIGKYTKRKEIPAKVSGKAVFGIDIEVPNMVYACILHSPVLHGKVTAIDDTEAKKITGIQQIIKTERRFGQKKADAVAVIANNYWAAQKGRKALKVTWDNGNFEKTQTTDAYFEECYKLAKGDGILQEAKGDFKAKYASAKEKIEAVYETPFLAHAPLEPECAVVHVKEDGTVDAWVHSQSTSMALGEITRALGVKADKVNIQIPLIGGSFGRKHYHDYLIEACLLAKELKKPVKVLWTREDDISQGPFRPGMVNTMQGFVNRGRGVSLGYSHHAVGESIMRQVFGFMATDEPDAWVVDDISFDKTRYNFAQTRISSSNVKTDIPVLWWRSVYPSNTAFAQECFIDELAHLAKKDPITARLDLLSDERHKNVLKILSQKSNYKEKLPEGQATGIAMFASIGTIVATAITVSKKENGVKIEKVVTVIDCGQYVSPEMVKAQTEGNIIMGLTAAIKNPITFKNGACEQSNFHNYPVMRINEAPKIEIHIVDSGVAPGGVAEPGLPPVAPALGNAIFAATGKRIRKLPFDLENL